MARRHTAREGGSGTPRPFRRPKDPGAGEAPELAPRKTQSRAKRETKNGVAPKGGRETGHRKDAEPAGVPPPVAIPPTAKRSKPPLPQKPSAPSTNAESPMPDGGLHTAIPSTATGAEVPSAMAAARPAQVKPDPQSIDIEAHTTPPVMTAPIDVEALAHNVGRLVEEGGRAIAAYLKPREQGERKLGYADEIADTIKTLGQVLEYWYADPKRALEMQTRIGRSFLDLFTVTARRLAGEAASPVATPDPKDKRFVDEYYDFLKQAYLVTSDLAKHLVDDAQTLDPATRHKAEFYVRQIVNAISPSNFLLTNPELIRTTLNENAANLVRGAHMLAEDIEAGGGELKIRQSDPSSFVVGRNLAATLGKVVYQNALMQLIQYEPTTERVLKRPLLIVPPWINKFYILDLAPDKSFVKWCVDQGLTVFIISWVNPDERLAGKSFADYMREGPIEALDVISRITGEERINTVGYCVGGTLLAVLLAYLAARKDRRIASATLLTAQIDFTYAGDLKVFVATEEQVAALEREMAQHGYLDGSKMATAFNLLRSNDLVWPYVVNNYLKGEAPFPFDLLYWNSDATRMPAANHSFYVRHCYLNNDLAKGAVEIDGIKIDLRRVKVPIYNLATREDHIAPAKSVYVGASCFGGPVRFVLAASGHIAGVVNPPERMKYQYWTGDAPHGEDVEAWISRANAHKGSWWSDWIAWVRQQDGEEVPARKVGGGRFDPIEDAPGSYVKVKT
jgi:polyhydroxyalkanoate synthase subunit PhaC